MAKSENLKDKWLKGISEEKIRYFSELIRGNKKLLEAIGKL